LISVNYDLLVRWNDEKYSSLQSFVSEKKLELNAVSESNLPFADFANNNFTLSPTSLLIDAGVYISGINDGYNGVAPDIGAFENGN